VPEQEKNMFWRGFLDGCAECTLIFLFFMFLGFIFRM